MNDLFKQKAAEKALEYVKSGMILGLGTGSTVSFFLDYLARDIKSGKLTKIRGIPTSEATAKKSQELGIELMDLGDLTGPIDLAVDGADEVDPDLQLVKGLGKALLREKMVEINATKFLVIVDESKMVSKLATKGPLPVEIVKYGHEATVKWLGHLPGCRAEFWLENGQPALTDNGNYLVKCWFEKGIENVKDLSEKLSKRPGVVEHGLFVDMASLIVVAGESGAKIITKN